MERLPSVIYRAPRSNRIAGWIAIVLLGLVFAGINAIILSVNGQPWYSASPSQQGWLYYAPYGVLGAGLILITYALLRSHKTRLILSEESVSIGNAILHRRVLYDDVGVVELEEPERRGGRTLRLHVRSIRGRRCSMELPAADAEECFHALRNLCPNVPAIGIGSAVFATADPTYASAGQATLVAEFRRKARGALWAALGCGIACVGGIVGLFFSSGARSHPKLWMMALVMPLVAIALLRRSRAFREHAQHLDDQGTDDVSTAP